MTRDDERQPEPRPSGTAWNTEAERAAVVESAIQQAMRQGAFDSLPGAGKPIEDLGTHHDPDWWIRRKIQTEKLEGLGPPPSRCALKKPNSSRRWTPFVERLMCANTSRTSTAASLTLDASLWAGLPS